MSSLLWRGILKGILCISGAVECDIGLIGSIVLGRVIVINMAVALGI